MGCCSSTSRVNVPKRLVEAKLPNSSVLNLQGTYEEDEKAPEKQGKSNSTKSSDSDGKTPDSTAQSPVEKNEEKEKEAKDNSNRQICEESQFDLYKEFEKSFLKAKQAEKDIDKGDVSLLDAFQPDESRIKITYDQHKVIRQFVEEKRLAIQRGIAGLYEVLSKNVKEHEKVAFFIEELKNNIKDIQNCMEDLVQYSFFNDKEYYEMLDSKRELIQKLTFEYGTFQKNLRSFAEFKNKVTSLLLEHDSLLPTAGLYPSRYGLNLEESIKRPEREKSLVFVPKDMSILGLDESRVHNQEFDINLGVISGNGFLTPEILKPKKDEIKEGEKKYVVYRKNSRDLNVMYYKFLEDLELAHQNFDGFKEGLGIVKAEVQEYNDQHSKGSKDAIPLQDLEGMEKNLYKENESLKSLHKELQAKLDELWRCIREGKTDLADVEYQRKLRETEIVLKKRIEDLEDISKTIPQIFKCLHDSQKVSASPGNKPNEGQVPVVEGRQEQVTKKTEQYVRQDLMDSTKLGAKLATSEVQQHSLKTSMRTSHNRTVEGLELHFPEVSISENNERSPSSLKFLSFSLPINRVDSNVSNTDSGNSQEKKIYSQLNSGNEATTSRQRLYARS